MQTLLLTVPFVPALQTRKQEAHNVNFGYIEPGADIAFFSLFSRHLLLPCLKPQHATTYGETTCAQIIPVLGAGFWSYSGISSSSKGYVLWNVDISLNVYGHEQQYWLQRETCPCVQVTTAFWFQLNSNSFGENVSKILRETAENFSMKVHVPKLPAILINLSNVVHFKASQLLKMSVRTLPEQKEKNNSRGSLFVLIKF